MCMHLKFADNKGQNLGKVKPNVNKINIRTKIVTFYT